MSTNAPSVKKAPKQPIIKTLASLYEQRWLIWYFVQREISKSYKNRFLGFAWAFLGPLMMVVLYTLVFSEIIGLKFREVEGNPTLNFGLYLYCGLLPYLAFSDTMNQATNCIRGNRNLVRRVIFPLEILPLNTTVASLADKLFGFVALVFMLLVLGVGLKATMLLLPLVVVMQLLFNLGLSYLFAVVGTYLPDVKETLRAFVRAMFFVTPILWTADRVPEKMRFLVVYNPLAFLVESYRAVILDGEPPDWTHAFWFTLFAAALFVVGVTMFERTKKRFADLL